MTNCTEYLYLVLGAHRLGVAAVPINFRLSADEIAFVIADCAPTVLAVDDALLDTARAAGSRAGVTPAILTVGSSEGDDEFATAVAERGKRAPIVDVAEDSTALIVYTSGTTGAPKGAVLTHVNLASATATLIRAWRLFGDDEIILGRSAVPHRRYRQRRVDPGGR